MAKTTPPSEKPAPEALDEHHGHGGSYTVGADGKRVLKERTGPAEALAATDTEPAKE